MNKKELINGKQFFFNNENHQISIGDDDLRQAKVWFDGDESGMPQWARGFKIFFNGVLLHSSKTFKSMENRLNKLIEKWNLESAEEL